MWQKCPYFVYYVSIISFFFPFSFNHTINKATEYPPLLLGSAFVTDQLVLFFSFSSCNEIHYTSCSSTLPPSTFNSFPSPPSHLVVRCTTFRAPRLCLRRRSTPPHEWSQEISGRGWVSKIFDWGGALAIVNFLRKCKKIRKENRCKK